MFPPSAASQSQFDRPASCHSPTSVQRVDQIACVSVSTLGKGWYYVCMYVSMYVHTCVYVCAFGKG